MKTHILFIYALPQSTQALWNCAQEWYQRAKEGDSEEGSTSAWAAFWLPTAPLSAQDVWPSSTDTTSTSAFLDFRLA